jgi:hypothetical protein
MKGKNMNVRLLAGLTAAATTAVLVGGASGASASAAQNDPWGCPEGAVCIVNPDNFTTIDAFYSYGAHNLSNKIGSYWVDNNQTDLATADLCYGYNGVNCTGGHLGAYDFMFTDLTPINSIRLNRP